MTFSSEPFVHRICAAAFSCRKFSKSSTRSGVSTYMITDVVSGGVDRPELPDALEAPDAAWVASYCSIWPRRSPSTWGYSRSSRVSVGSGGGTAGSPSSARPLSGVGVGVLSVSPVDVTVCATGEAGPQAPTSTSQQAMISPAAVVSRVHFTTAWRFCVIVAYPLGVAAGRAVLVAARIVGVSGR